MIRYRSASTAPGVKPPAWIESDDASLPTREDDGGRCAFRAIDGDATFVGNWDTDDTDSPHEAQKRAATGTSAEQEGQRVSGSKSRCSSSRRESNGPSRHGHPIAPDRETEDDGDRERSRIEVPG